MFGIARLVAIAAGNIATPTPPPGPPGTSTFVVLGDSAATIQTKLNSVTAGNSLVFPAGSFNLSGTDIVGKNGITVWAAGVVNITGGDFDFSSKSDWTVRGVSSTQTTETGFVFANCRVTATTASGAWAVGNCTFNSCAARGGGFEGSCVDFSFASGGTIINCTMNSCLGTAMGFYNYDNMSFDGLHFNACRQGFSGQMPANANTAFGNNLAWRRNVFLGMTRCCIEIGPTSFPAPGEYFNGTVVDNNFFDDFNNSDDPLTGGTLLPISCVGLASINMTVTNNYLRKGSTNSGWIAPGIEFAGSGTATNNTMVNFTYGALTYESGWVVTGNSTYNDGSNPFLGYVNNGSGSGTLSPNTILGGAPVVPSQPSRVSY